MGAIAVHLRELKNRVKGIFGCAQMRSDELYVPAASINCPLVGFDYLGFHPEKSKWQNIREILGRIDRLISYYEMKEATTIFELAWRKASLVNGEGRIVIEVPDPVKVTILEYIYSQNN